MPKISTSTTIVVPSGQRLMIQGIGAQATATVNPGSLGQIYDVSANGQYFFGPFDRATTVAIQISGGSVSYAMVGSAATVMIDDAGVQKTPAGSKSPISYLSSIANVEPYRIADPIKGSMGRQICTWPLLAAVSGDATLVSDLPPNPDNATKSVRIGRAVSPTTCHAAVEFAAYAPATGTFPSIGIWVKNPGTRVLDFRVRLWNAAFTRSIVYGGSALPGKGWRFMTMSPKATVLSTWTFGVDEIAAVRVEQYDAGSNGAWVDGEALIFGAVYADIKARPRFMLTFDDVPSNVIRPAPLSASSPASGRSAKQMLDYYGFKGTVYLSDKVFNTLSYGANTADALALIDAGWSVCSHSLSHPVDAAGAGLRLLGPYGYQRSLLVGNGTANCRVTSTTASTDTFTCEANHLLSLSSKIEFVNTAPTGFQTGVTYWITAPSGATFKLAATEALAQAGTALDVPSNWTGTAEWRWPGSAPDDSAIYADIVGCIQKLSDVGIRGHELFFALPQGGWDHYVRTAVERAGIRHTRGVASTSVTHRSIHLGYPTGGTVSNSPHWSPGWPEQADAISTDGVFTLLQATAYVDECIANGYTGANYHHSVSDSPDVLDGLLSYLKTKSDAGLIDVVTVWDLFEEVNLW